jgi:hypothetical protein
MPGWLLLAYLVLLLLLPLAARWRWGLAASLLVVTLELAVHRVIVDYRLIPLELSNPPPEHPKARITEHSFATFFRDMETWILPSLAALTGAVLSVVWTLCQAIWRAVRRLGVTGASRDHPGAC